MLTINLATTWKKLGFFSLLVAFELEVLTADWLDSGFLGGIASAKDASAASSASDSATLALVISSGEDSIVVETDFGTLKFSSMFSSILVSVTAEGTG